MYNPKAEEKFEDTKGMMRSRKSNKDRQYNGKLNIVYTKKAAQHLNQHICIGSPFIKVPMPS